MDELKKSFPKDIDYVVPFESVSVVRVSISEVMKTLIDCIGTGYTCGVFIPAKLAFYFNSCIGNSGFYHRHLLFFILLGFTINTLTMFGFVLAIGIVVDDAIIVVEAVQHYIDEKKYVCQRCYYTGNERYFRAGNRHCAYIGGSICSGWFYSRYRGQVVPAICDHYCHFGSYFCIRCLITYTGIMYPDAEAIAPGQYLKGIE